MPDDWLVVALRLGLYVALMVLFGVALFCVNAGIHSMQPDDRNATVARQYVRVIGFATALGIGLSLVSMVVMAKAMAGVDTYAELTAHVFDMILTATPVGLSWTVRVAALLATVVLALLRTRPAPRFGTLSILGAIALATLAWTGHGAINDGALGVLHLASDIAHLLAAGAWVGALFAFAVLSTQAQGSSPEEATARAAQLGRAADGFARIGTVIVVTLVVTGLVNYGLIVGPTVEGLLTTAYGRLLVAKLVLFAGMLVLAAANRYQLSPRLALALQNGDHAAAVTALRRSLTTEASLALGVLALVSWLGVLSPPGT
ncbi:copper homeostasis membrane protein CopD [Ralstonia sp. 24A2]|uniref:copper homeostasis membrane protein CopD n=1 Tax=Ralstonia sp. 24A2 TaxID=3447364 RepID=UPI003F698A4B